MDKRYFIAALFLGAATVVGMALVLPMYQKVRAVSELVRDHQKEFEAQNLLVNEIERLQTEYQQMEKEISQAAELVPVLGTQSVPDLFVELEGLASQTGLFIESISFSEMGKETKELKDIGTSSQKRDYSVVNVELGVKGTYQNIKRFSRAIETSKHLMDIVSLSLSASQVEVDEKEGAEVGKLTEVKEIFQIDIIIDAYYR